MYFEDIQLRLSYLLTYYVRLLTHLVVYLPNYLRSLLAKLSRHLCQRVMLIDANNAHDDN